MKRTLAAIAFAAALAASAQTQCVRLPNGETVCPPPDSKCVQDRYGDWFCSAPGGDAVLNINGNPICGAGACVKDINGETQCSTQARGAAAMDINAKAVCTAGCETASASRCAKLVK